MRACFGVIAIFLCAFFLFPKAHAKEDLFLDEIVAAVNDTAITRTQVIQEARFILAEQGQYWAGELPSSFLNKVLERLIAKEMIYQEMGRAAESVRKELTHFDASTLARQFQSRFVDTATYQRFLATLWMTQEAFEALLLRNKKIEAFMSKRLDLLSRVSEKEVGVEVKKLLQQPKLNRAHKRSLTKAEIGEMRDFARNAIKKAKYDTALKRWMKDLEARNRILRIVRFQKNIAAAPVKKDYQVMEAR